MKLLYLLKDLRSHRQFCFCPTLGGIYFIIIYCILFRAPMHMNILQKRPGKGMEENKKKERAKGKRASQTPPLTGYLASWCEHFSGCVQRLFFLHLLR